MSEVIHCAQNVKSVIGNLSTFNLTEMPDDVKEELKAELAAMNRSLAELTLEEEADYQHFGETDSQKELNALDRAASRAIDAELDRIVAELDTFHGEPLPVEAIRETREHRDLMIPRLIQSIKDAASSARAGKVPQGNLHFFAVLLLSEFQADEAFPVILEAFSLPDRLSFDLFGDAVTDTLARIIAQFAGDRPEFIDELIGNRDLNEFVRWEAAQTYLYMVRDGLLTRDEAVARLKSCLRKAIDQNDKQVIGGLICVLDDYAPKEAMDEIHEAFQKDLVDLDLIDLRVVEKRIAEGPAAMQEALENCQPTGIGDTIEELSGWPAFAEDEYYEQDDYEPVEVTPLPSPHPYKPHFPEPPSMGPKQKTVVRSEPKVGRNAPCPCGSGKKFKKCCGARK